MKEWFIFAKQNDSLFFTLISTLRHVNLISAIMVIANTQKSQFVPVIFCFYTDYVNPYNKPMREELILFHAANARAKAHLS